MHLRCTFIHFIHRSSVPSGFSFANQLKFYRKKLKLNIDCVTTTKTTSFNKYICSSIKTINPVVCCYWYCVRRSTHNAIPLFGMPFVNDSYIVQLIYYFFVLFWRYEQTATVYYSLFFYCCSALVCWCFAAGWIWARHVCLWYERCWNGTFLANPAPSYKSLRF